MMTFSPQSVFDQPLAIAILYTSEFPRNTGTCGTFSSSYDSSRVCTVGRYGGEEFLIISPGCDEEALLRRAENLRAVVANETVATPEASIAVSLSLGASVAVGEVAQDQLLKAADEALYRAKRAGRNRVELAR
jgi:diguanylate cyclase (GGDEF)-like protein